MPPERLQKVLSRRGVASRREAESWILSGRIRVNGAAVRELGVKVDPAEDRIEVDGAPLPAERRPITVLLNKPVGYVTTVRDPHAERTVMELVTGLKRRVYPVGRLDKESRGALLFTDDGDLAQLLLHPSRGVEKVYRVTAVGPFEATALQRLAEGVELEDGVTARARVWGVVRDRSRITFQIALCEGRKRQVRRMVQAVGWRAVDLERMSFGGLTTRGLAEGRWRILASREIDGLRRAARGETPRQRARGRGGRSRHQRRGRR
jgi:23S rRNA pseudouridine2605 synthase